MPPICQLTSTPLKVKVPSVVRYSMGVCWVILAKKWCGSQDASGVCAVHVCGTPPWHLPQPHAPPTKTTPLETPPWQRHWKNCGVKGCVYIYMYCIYKNAAGLQLCNKTVTYHHIVMVTFVRVNDSAFSSLNILLQKIYIWIQRTSEKHGILLLIIIKTLVLLLIWYHTASVYPNLTHHLLPQHELVALELSDIQHCDDIMVELNLTPDHLTVPIPSYVRRDRMSILNEVCSIRRTVSFKVVYESLGVWKYSLIDAVFILLQRNVFIDDCLRRAGLEAVAEEEVSPLSVSEAIVLLQRHERARQGRARAEHRRDVLARQVSTPNLYLVCRVLKELQYHKFK